MSFRRLPALTVLLAVAGLLVSHSAFAWVEMTVSGHEARVELMRNGSARVEHKVVLKVRGGPLRSFDLPISDKEVTIGDEPTFVRTGGMMGARTPVPVTVERRPDGALRVDIDGKKGVRRGDYELVVIYDVDLLKQSAITRDGSMLRVSWVGPRWENGIDNAKCTFAVPASPTEPTAVGEVTLGGPDEGSITAPLGSFLATLTRLPEFDELTLIRPHVARDEAVGWTIRIDPAAMGSLNDPRLAPKIADDPVSMVPPERRALYLGIGAAIALLFSVLLALKHHQVVRACEWRGVHPRPLLPVGIALRVAFAGPLLAVAIAAQVFMTDPLPGSLGVLVVVLLTVYRTPERKSVPRGPGRWLPLTDDQAFAKPKSRPSGWLDAGTLAGKILLVMPLAAWAGGVYVLARHQPYFAHLAALDIVLLAALFGTGRQGELPADPVVSAAPILKSLAQTLRKSKKLVDVRVRGFGRVPTASTELDELRLALKPKATLHGFTSIEVGLGWAHGAGGSVALPQVLVRAVDGSACHEALTQRLRHARWLRGREIYERVLVLSPALPTEDLTSRLVESVVHAVRHAPQTDVPQPQADKRKPRRPQRPPVRTTQRRRAPNPTPRPPAVRCNANQPRPPSV